MNLAILWDHASQLTKRKEPPLAVRDHEHNLPAKPLPSGSSVRASNPKMPVLSPGNCIVPQGTAWILPSVWTQGVTFSLMETEVRPGEYVTLNLVLSAPPSAGKHGLEVDSVKQNVALFSECGSPVLRRQVEAVTGALMEGLTV